MKISLEWLNDYLPGPTEAQTAADALTHGGLPVEVIETVGDDTVIDVEVTSNRPDCLSHVGVGRELAALLKRDFRDVKPVAKESGTPASSVTQVRIDAPQLCSHYTARILRNVKIGPSPAWLVRRLEAIGLRSINNVVDVTNYVMFEMGQPLHAFDFDKLDGKRIVVRTAAKGEKLISIDGHERALSTDMLVIADASKAVALAGVMGGRDSEVSDTTVNVLLESARFDPLSVRKTARALAMKSDSSYRFERGIDPTLPIRAAVRAAQLILDTAGGELLAGFVEAGSGSVEPKKLAMRLPRLKQILGVELPTDQVVDAFQRLGLAPVRQGDRIDVTVPSHRLDLNIEVDLIEEAARVIGYDKIPTRDEISIRVTAPEPSAAAFETIRNVLVGAGYFEAITFSFVTDALAGDFAPPGAIGADGKPRLPRADAAVRKADAFLRPSIVPGLLEAVARNENAGTMDARLFETGSTFWLDAAANTVVEVRKLSLVGSTDVREIRGVIETLLERLNAERAVRVVPDAHNGYARAGCGRIEWDGKTIGYFGKVDRAVADRLSLRSIPTAAELDLVALIEGMQHVPQLHPLPKFPAVRRDLSLIVSEQTRFDAIDQVIRETKPEMLEDFEFVTTYRGKPLEKGTKSVTVTLVFRSSSGTLTSDQVEQSVQRVVSAAKEQLGATLRG